MVSIVAELAREPTLAFDIGVAAGDACAPMAAEAGIDAGEEAAEIALRPAAFRSPSILPHAPTPCVHATVSGWRAEGGGALAGNAPRASA